MLKQVLILLILLQQLFHRITWKVCSPPCSVLYYIFSLSVELHTFPPQTYFTLSNDWIVLIRNMKLRNEIRKDGSAFLNGNYYFSIFICNIFFCFFLVVVVSFLACVCVCFRGCEIGICREIREAICRGILGNEGICHLFTEGAAEVDESNICKVPKTG